MDIVARAAFITAQAACAQIEAVAMQAQNAEDVAAGRPITFRSDAFMALQDQYMIGHNAVIQYMMG